MPKRLRPYLHGSPKVASGVLEIGRVALLGVLVGVLVARGVTRFLTTLPFGVEPLDVWTFLAMSGPMLVVGLLASYIPAWRASSVEPMTSLTTD